MGIALALFSLARDERPTALGVAAVVYKDSAIASRPLKYVNSPLAGLSRKVASLLHEVALLGIHTVKSIALGLSLVSRTRKGRCEKFNCEAFCSYY